MKVFLTGGNGFMGGHFIELLKKQGVEIVAPTRAEWDFTQPWESSDPNVPSRDVPENVDYFVHMGANVHAPKSLVDPEAFVQANVVGTFNALELARKMKPSLFVYISSAEALGGNADGYKTEDEQLRPSNPYAATKGAGELLTYSYFRSFELPAITVRSMNVYSLDQTDETKFVPMVRKAVETGTPLKIHVKDGKPGVRQWCHVNSFVQQLYDLLPVAEPGQTYHIIGEELDNVEIANRIADEIGKPLKVEFIRQSRTHEWRYALQRTR
jgi:dTDP-glucose 4,6-dehydratase